MRKIDEKDFLNCIYKNAEMGIIGIDDVIEKVENTQFEKLLKKQRKEYENITKEVELILNKYYEDNENISLLAKISTKIMSEMVILKDNSVSKIAKMMMNGTNKGIVELVEKINSYNGKDKDIVILANKFQKTLENNIEDLKEYL